jgi:maltooligosyltrehalose trehalohydrolase
MVAQNPAYWMREFHVDGFRLDATHAIVDESQPHLLQELTSSIHSLGGFAIAEDPRNEAQLLLPPEENGLGFDGVWADDFHHCTRVPNTGEQDAYLADFSGSLEEVLETLRHGWLYRGQESRVQGKPRGTECSHIAPEKFFHCISNHDQTGNHAFGERLGHKISPEAYRAASALLLLSPYAPLLFMGQEWNASTPFQFFTDHNDELGRLITEGRREEFKDFAAFRDPEVRHRIPDPQSVQTFRDSKLRWEDLSEERHAKVLALYRSCLQLRLSDAAFRPQSRDSYRVSDIDSGVGAIQLFAEKADWLMLFDLVGGHSGSLLKNIPAPTADGHWQLVLSSNEERFGGTKSGDEILSADIEFPAAECAVYRWDK